jgi:hypothetical protein
VSFSFSFIGRNVDEFNQIKQQTSKRAFSNLPSANNNIQGLVSGFSFKSMIQSMFHRTKNSYNAENDFFAAINVKRNPVTESVFTTPILKKRDVVQPKLPGEKNYSSEPIMKKGAYDDFLKTIYEFGKNIEKKPSLYIGKGEEDLRDQFILILETRYEGTTATGETFNRSGKTDIILKYANDGSNLFVAECKLWHGESEMLKAVTQILSYLTWRDSKAALMLFVQIKNFTGVLDSITKGICKHPNFKKSNGTRGESSFSYIFGLPQDSDKNIYLEVMAFHYDKSK